MIKKSFLSKMQPLVAQKFCFCKCKLVVFRRVFVYNEGEIGQRNVADLQEDAMSFSENLYYLRKRDKITQEELADRLGVTRQSVSKWETGEASPETDKLILICDLFGVSLDDIVRTDLTKEPKQLVPAEEAPAEEDEREFIAKTNKFSKWIALGVFLILFGVSVCVLLGAISDLLVDTASELTAIMGGVSVVLFVAVAVFLFIFAGMEYDRFRKEHPVMPKVYDDAECKAFGRKFSIAMACLTSAILLDVVVLIVFTSLIGVGTITTGNKDAAQCFVVAAFLCVLSFIVGGYVYFGIQHTKYNIEEYNKLGEGKSEEDAEHKAKRKKFCDALCGTIMLAATGIYLLMGFVWHLWHPGWIIFPLGGIICAIVNTIAGIKK